MLGTIFHSPFNNSFQYCSRSVACTYGNHAGFPDPCRPVMQVLGRIRQHLLRLHGQETEEPDPALPGQGDPGVERERGVRTGRSGGILRVAAVERVPGSNTGLSAGSRTSNPRPDYTAGGDWWHGQV